MIIERQEIKGAMNKFTKKVDKLNGQLTLHDKILNDENDERHISKDKRYVCNCLGKCTCKV